MFFVHYGACDAVEVVGYGAEFVGEGWCVEVLDWEVDPFAAPEDAVPETAVGFEYVGFEEGAVDGE